MDCLNNSVTHTFEFVSNLSAMIMIILSCRMSYKMCQHEQYMRVKYIAHIAYIQNKFP